MQADTTIRIALATFQPPTMVTVATPAHRCRMSGVKFRLARPLGGRFTLTIVVAEKSIPFPILIERSLCRAVATYGCGGIRPMHGGVI